jgi:hypothetical protein|tara:strand:- start:169 stop:333 length:165 start_codon:yes stop_codon:yes gene_type:complete
MAADEHSMASGNQRPNSKTVVGKDSVFPHAPSFFRAGPPAMEEIHYIFLVNPIV